jgi:hypothetical protein
MSITIVSHLRQNRHPVSLSRQKSSDFVQLSLFQPIATQPEAKPTLQIEAVPVKTRVDPKETRYILKIKPIGVRACGGQYNANEIFQIEKATTLWDWTLDAANRLYCLHKLESLVNEICKQSAFDGGAL